MTDINKFCKNKLCVDKKLQMLLIGQIAVFDIVKADFADYLE